MVYTKKVLIILNFLLFISICNSSLAIEKKKFLSLKKNTVNLRQGPSKNYPVKLIYKKKFLPLEVLDSWENWRKVKDFENNNGWIHISLLSGKKTAINKINHSIIFRSNTIYSRPLAKVEEGRLVLIKKCKIDWCKIVSGDFMGWIKKETLWGNIN